MEPLEFRFSKYKLSGCPERYEAFKQGRDVWTKAANGILEFGTQTHAGIDTEKMLHLFESAVFDPEAPHDWLWSPCPYELEKEYTHHHVGAIGKRTIVFGGRCDMVGYYPDHTVIFEFKSGRLKNIDREQLTYYMWLAEKCGEKNVCGFLVGECAAKRYVCELFKELPREYERDNLLPKVCRIVACEDMMKGEV